MNIEKTEKSGNVETKTKITDVKTSFDFIFVMRILEMPNLSSQEKIEMKTAIEGENIGTD